MKIAMVSLFPEQPNLFRGGVEAVAGVLVNALQAIEKVHIHVIAPFSGIAPTTEVRDGVTVHWLPRGRLPGFIGYWTLFRRRVHALLKNIQPDITHFQGYAGWTLRYDRPYVLTIHGIAEKDVDHHGGPFIRARKTVFAMVERMGRRKSMHTIVINPYVLSQIGSQVLGKRHFIENPIDCDVFETQHLCQCPRVLYVGRINKRKNVEGLIEAFALLKILSPQATLNVAGVADSTIYFEQCRRLVAERGLQESVHFLGNLDRKAVLNELSRAACLVLLSQQETAPIIVGEAMAARVPVVATGLCGLPYMVEDGRSGFLVDLNNIGQIAEKIHLVLSSSQMAAAMGERAHQIALSRFHAYDVARRTFLLYEEILNSWARQRLAD
ncbi:MAG: glycosyltransferase family 4 protein [Nitrospira sp.]|nr:glycosyltransferase family 4 protein [Nitrospira sp.]